MIRRLAALAALAILATGCATTASAPDPRDPLEPMNRAVFEFNDGLDRALIKPAAEAYQFVVPSIARTAVTNFFGNLGDIWNGANQLMQGKVEAWINDWARVLFNTTFGAGGLADVASEMGLPKHDEDFGQTLGVWGVPPGAYLVLPVFGPSSVRDTAGFVVDAYAYPTFWILRTTRPPHWVSWRTSLTLLDFLNRRTNALALTDVLEQAALDRYAYVRSAYFQRRRNQIYDGSPPPEQEAALPAIPTQAAAELLRILQELDAAAAGTGEASGARRVEPKVPRNYDAVLAATAARAVAAGPGQPDTEGH
ncbi:MAG: VacJ family lipoprotein [Burkholderiales bacterium]|nr:VacJ family lipoprotein [Burkholderiales bacterium]